MQHSSFLGKYGEPRSGKSNRRVFRQHVDLIVMCFDTCFVHMSPPSIHDAGRRAAHGR